MSCFSANRSNFAPCRLDFRPASSQITTAFCNPPRFSALRKKSSTVVGWRNPSFRNTRAADVVGVTAIRCARRLPQSALHFLERRGLSGSRYATKTEHSILCGKNRANGVLLFLGEICSGNKTGIQRGAGVFDVVDVFHCPLFQLQTLAGAAF